jgi:uncharacterized membrane protein YqjE
MDDDMTRRRAEELAAHSGPEALPTPGLLQQISSDAKSLLQMQVELAKEEAKVDLNAELDLAKGAVVGAVCAILGLNMLLIAAVFALAPEMAWVVALIVGVVLLGIAAAAAFIGWKRAEKDPLHTTRKSLMEDVEWAKRQIR